MSPAVPVLLAAAAGAVLMAAPGGTLRLAALHRRRPDSPPQATAAAAGAGLLVLLALGPVVALLLGAAVLVVRRGVAVRREAEELRREREAGIDALALLAGELRAGRAPASALAAAAEVARGPTRSAFASAAAAARLGGDVPSALISEQSAVGSTLRGLAACWQVCEQSGSGLAGAIGRLEASARSAEEQRRAVDAELAGPRATAQLLAALPVAGIALAAALGAHPVHVLLHTPAGVGCLLGGLLLDAAGLLWTGRLVRAATA